MLSKKQIKLFPLGGIILFMPIFIGLSTHSLTVEILENTNSNKITDQVKFGRQLGESIYYDSPPPPHDRTRKTFVENFDFTNHSQANYLNGQGIKIGNYYFQNDYSVTSQDIKVENGVLSFESGKDDEAWIMDIDRYAFSNRSYYARTVLKPTTLGYSKSGMYGGILMHADAGGTAHPETEGVIIGLMYWGDEWRFKAKQWTDGTIYESPPLKGFDPNAWYLVEVEVNPRDADDTMFSGQLFKCDNQSDPTVADSGTLLAGFTDKWQTNNGEYDNSDPTQWNPRLHDIALAQWYGNVQFHSIGISKTREGFKKPLIYTDSKSKKTGEKFYFKSSPMLPVENYIWDFGDGTTSSYRNPDKSYSTSGIYTVTLTTAYSGEKGTYTSETMTIHVMPSSGSDSSINYFSGSKNGWFYEDKGIENQRDTKCNGNYIFGTHDESQGGGSLMIEAFNHSPGSPLQDGDHYKLDNFDLNGVSGQWYKKVNLSQSGDISISFKYKILTSGLDSNHVFKIIVTDNGSFKKTLLFTDDKKTGFESVSVTYSASGGLHKIALLLWCETLSSKQVTLDADAGNDGPVNDKPRRCNLVTHRWDHWDDNGKVSVWFDEISIKVPGDALPAKGEIIGTYIVPSHFNSLNGLGWDGSQLWAVDFVDAATGRAHRMNVSGSNLFITRTLNLKLPKMEGAAHDGNNILYTGPRVNGERGSEKIIAHNHDSGNQLTSYSSYLWPDGKSHGNYKDPDGIAYGKGNIFWVCNADHTAELNKAGVQIMDRNGLVIKRFWLPDEKVNDIAYAGGYLIYKPYTENIIRIIDISASFDGGDAVVKESFAITGGTVNRHWGAAHDGSGTLYLSQDNPGGSIWKIYLPVEENQEKRLSGTGMK